MTNLENVILKWRMKLNKELNIMTTTSNNARRFSPIFVATVTPATVSTRTDKNGNKYAHMAGATIAQEGKETKTMTTMAFGKSYAEVGKLLRKGRAVDLAVQFDGGPVKVIGLPRAEVAEDRKSVVSGKRVSVRGARGGSRIIKTKKTQNR